MSTTECCRTKEPGDDCTEALRGHRNQDSTNMYTHTFESHDTLSASRLLTCFPVLSVGRVWNAEPLGSWISVYIELSFFDRTEGFSYSSAWFLTKRDFTPCENSPQLIDFCAARANECAQPGHSTDFHHPKLPFFVGARGFEPRAS